MSASLFSIFGLRVKRVKKKHRRWERTKSEWRKVLIKPLQKLGMSRLVELFIELLYLNEIMVTCFVYEGNIVCEEVWLVSKETQLLKINQTLARAAQCVPRWRHVINSSTIKVLVQQGHAKPPFYSKDVDGKDWCWLDTKSSEDTIADIFLEWPKRYLCIMHPFDVRSRVFSC